MKHLFLFEKIFVSNKDNNKITPLTIKGIGINSPYIYLQQKNQKYV